MDWATEIDSILSQVDQAGESISGDLEGCSEEDIGKIEEHFGLELPAAYVALLKRSGRCWGELMQGEDFSFPEVLLYRRAAESLLEGVSDFLLDRRDFVFFMHQGYHFLFFRVGQEDDPEVFLYNADERSVEKLFSSFSEWLDFCMKEEVALRSGRSSSLLGG